MSASTNEDDYDDVNTTISPFPSPVKVGGIGVNLGLSSPGNFGSGYNASSLDKTTDYAVFQSFESQCSLNLKVVNDVNDDTQIKPLSPLPENIVEIEQHNDEVDGQKTLADLKNYSEYSDSSEITQTENCELDTNFESGQNQNFPDNNENDGYESPASSQGSMQSGEYLAKNVEAIERNSIRAQENVLHLKHVLPKEAYKIFEDYFKDSDGVDRFLSYVKKDVMCTSYYTGACQRNSVEAEKIKKQLESHDPIALLGVIGRIMTNTYVDQMRQGQTSNISNINAAQTYEKMDIGMVEESITQSEPVPGRLLNKEFFENPQSASSIIDTCKNVQVFKQEQASSSSVVALQSTGNSSMPNVPDYRYAADAVPVPSDSKRRNKRHCVSEPDKIKSLAAQLPPETWDNANDKLRGYKKEKQIEKVGQVFFEVVFDQEEKDNCTRSGKRKSNSNETQSIPEKRPFDKCKVRFIRFAVAFILSKPSTRNSKTFLKAITDVNFKDLSTTEEEILNKKVLSEYAYRKRPKTNKK